MKNLFKSLMLIAVAAMAFTSCSKDSGVENTTEGPKMKLTLRAGNPEVMLAVSDDSRTELVGGVPYWSVGDQIGVSTNGTSDNAAFKNDNTSAASQTTTFTGETAVSSTIYTYYPFTGNGIGAVTGNTGAKIDLPANQNPTATSFDGKADLLVGKPLTLTESSTTVTNLQFARVGGIVKVILKDNSTNNKLSGEHVATLSVTTDGTNYLAGRVVLDIVNGKLYEPYYNQSNKVTANYTASTQYEVNGTNATFLGVYPRTLDAGAKLTIEAETEGYSISKEITLPAPLEIIPGKQTTLNITLTDANLTPAATGFALPFTDDFSWVPGNTTTALPIDKFPKNQSNEPLYSATAYAYPDTTPNVLKLGSSNSRGYFTTADLNLSQAFTVIVRAADYGTDGSTLNVSIGDNSQTAALTSDYKFYKFEFAPQGNKAKVKVQVDGKRGYIADFQVLSGHDVELPTILTITSEETMNLAAAGGVTTITYSLENPKTDVSIAASADGSAADWINTFDSETPGEISFLVEENKGEAREGTVTVTYGDISKTITIKQAAPVASGTFVATFTVNALGLGSDGTDINNKAIIENGATMTFTKGSDSNPPKYYAAGIRMYTANKLTISAPGNITSVVFTFVGTYNKINSATPGTYTAATNTWTGSANSILFGASAQTRIASVVVTYTVD